MALRFTCEKGHGYITTEFYSGNPDAPRCPICYKEWEKEQLVKETIQNMNTGKETFLDSLGNIITSYPSHKDRNRNK